MATYLANLQTARNQTAALIVSITANPKPDYSIDGESISWAAYLSNLTDRLEALDKAIQRAQSPFARHSRGRA